MSNSAMSWNTTGLAGEVTNDIRIESGIKFMFADGSDEQLRKFERVGELGDPDKSPILMVRCYNKTSIADLVSKAERYDKTVGLGGVIVAVPEPMDKGVTQKAYADVQTQIQDIFPDKPFLLVAHERFDYEDQPINPFDAPQNLATAILRHQQQKYGIDSDIPLWCHSYAPELTDDQLAHVRSSLQSSPYLLSVRTKKEDLQLSNGMRDSISAIRDAIENLPEGLPQEHIANLKQLFRSTCMIWSVNHQSEITGGFNRLFSGERIAVDQLPADVRPNDFDEMVLKAGGEEDTDNFIRLAQNSRVQKILKQVLDGQMVKYFDPDVRPERESKFERAWSKEPHPAHYSMFPQIAETDEHRAALAIQQKIAENEHRIPEDWRGVRFV